MREIAAVFEKGFTKGLRPQPNHPRNADTLIECMDMVPNDYGVIGRPKVFNPFAGDFVVDWPFPMLARCVEYTFFITRSAIYKVDESFNLSYVGSVAFTDQPHIGDFGETVYFASPGVSYVMAPDGFAELSPLDMSFATCANYGGQLIVANGYVPKGLALREKDISPSQQFEVVESATEVKGKTLIAWSKINVLDFTFDLSTEAGFSKAMWPGEVLRLLPLGDEIVVYGDAGIAKMKPFQKPVASYGFSNYAKFGIVNRNCVAGDNQTHICIGNDYALYAIRPQRALSEQGYAPERLGFQEYISKLVDPVITFEPIFRHWWVCGKNAAYILTEAGLGQSSVTSTAVVSVDGRPVGITDPVAPEGAVVTTNLVSFGTRGIKLLAAIELDMESHSDAFCQVLYRTDYRAPLAEGQKIFIDPRGTVFPTAAGTEFCVRVISANYESLMLSKLRLRYKTVDRTSVRGAVNAGQITE